jgi:hypothetical protein
VKSTACVKLLRNFRFVTISAILLLCILLTANPDTAAAGDAYQTGEGNDGRFGVVEAYEDPEAADELGVGWSRVLLNWAEAQAGGPGTWTPTVSDAQIGREIAGGRLVVGLLIGIPNWARGADRLPRGLWLPHTDPGNRWANFVREAVGRYEGRINHWIIWNEPDIHDSSTPGRTWEGGVEDFVQLQRVAYLVAKEANPDAVIHLAAFTHFWDPTYLGRFLDVVAADPAAVANNHYFDVATAHLYFQADSIYNLIQEFSGVMAGHGLAKPVWLVETNAPPINDPAWPVRNWTLSVTLDEQAAFVPQALASALAAGAERVAIYKLKDTAGDRAANPEPFGLLRENGRRRPAYTTYQVAIRYLSGATAITRERWDGVGQIRLDQGEHSTTVLFARLPVAQQAQVPATADSGALVDMWGKRWTVTAANGIFTIDLPPALCTQSIGDYCMIGGTTYYLVQSAAGPARSATPPVTSLAITPTIASTLTPSATTSPTPTISPTASPTTSPTSGPPTPPITPTTTAMDDAEESELATISTGNNPSEGDEGILVALFPGAAVVLGLGIGSWWLFRVMNKGDG